jgi:hypothetical protein
MTAKPVEEPIFDKHESSPIPSIDELTKEYEDQLQGNKEYGDIPGP